MAKFYQTAPSNLRYTWITHWWVVSVSCNVVMIHQATVYTLSPNAARKKQLVPCRGLRDRTLCNPTLRVCNDSAWVDYSMC